MTPASIEETTAQAENLLGSRVSVRGPLGLGLGSCTLSGCSWGCCNECSSASTLGPEATVRGSDFERRKRTVLLLVGPHLGCRGDESLVCCDYEAAGQEVIAQGTLRAYTSMYALEDTTLCVPPPRP